MFFEFCLGLRTADFLFSIRHIAFNTVHRDILSLGSYPPTLLPSLSVSDENKKIYKIDVRPILGRTFGIFTFGRMPLCSNVIGRKIRIGTKPSTSG
jgi:hypothetical protein